jgi:Kef-type K+ transport system membrane component KefB
MTNAELGALLLAFVCLLAAAHGFGYLFERMRLPRVAGEIVGGLVLGPTVLGRLAPTLQASVFQAFPEETRLLTAVYWIGLILLMFVSGFRIQHDLAPEDRRTVAILVAAALVAPFAVGFAVPLTVDFSAYQGASSNPLSFHLVFAIGFAVTSIPVISKIFIDLGVIRTRFASIVLATATVEDIVLWVALAVATKLAATRAVEMTPLAQAVAITILFLGLSLWLGPRLVLWISQLRINLLLKASRVGYVLLICFVFASVANLLDVNVVFGALVAGIIVARLPAKDFETVRERIAEVSLGTVVPIYFAIVGFRLDLIRDFDLGLTLVFLVASSAVKLACVAIGARFAGHPWTRSLDLAMAMNARGGPGIVLGSVAYEFGIVDARLFMALVLTAVLTSILSGTWLRRALSSGRNLDS